MVPAEADARPIDVRACARHAAGAGALAVGFCAVFFFTAAHRDVAWFVHFGRNSSAIGLARQVLGPHVRVPHLDGHDGQAFWVLARDPLLRHPHSLAASLDRPVYRAQRILYPLVSAPWRVFGERGLLWGMLVTNILAVVAGTAFTSALAQDLKIPSRAVLAFPLAPAVLIALGFDMSDVMALAATMAVLFFIRRGRLGAAIVAGALAGLAKEPSLFALGALAVLLPGLALRARAMLVGIPAAVVGAWALYMRWRFGWPASQIQEFTPIPFYGYLDAWRRGWHQYGNYSDAMMAVVVLLVAAAVVAVWWRNRRSPLMIAALPYAVMIPFVSAQVLDLDDNSWRALGPAVTLLVLALYAEGKLGVKPGQPAGPAREPTPDPLLA